jgi:hypothetical protein
VSVWDADHALLRGAGIAPGPLPGTVRITGLPAIDQTLRVVVASDPATHELGYARVNVRAHAETATTLLLSADTADGDGDGVPDAIDDCPTVPDPDQNGGAACALGDGGDGGGAIDLSPGGFCYGGNSPCGGGSAADCQGFESGGIHTPWGTVVDPTPGSSYVVDGARACRGNFSFHATTPAIAVGNTARDFAWQNTITPAQQADLFVRAFYFVANSATEGTLLTAYQNQSPYLEIDFGVDLNGMPEIKNSVAPKYTHGTAPFPTDRWVCVEMEILSSATAGNINVWIDEQLTITQSQVPTAPTGMPLATMGAGVFYYQPSVAVPARDLFVDEVVVAPQRIGCVR